MFNAYVFLYVMQDTLLYQPSIPIRYTHENPRGYKSPEERQINYSPVILHTTDWEVLHGWFMAEHDPRIESINGEVAMREDRRLVVFFHENAGNLGLRLDFF